MTREYRPGIAEAGRAIYQEKILPTLGEEDTGKLVVIDVDTGDWEVNADHIAALLSIRERNPNAYTWAARVGHRAAYRAGNLPASQL